MLADGGRCVSDLIALGLQPALFGDVASISTARRVLLSVGEAELGRLRSARPGAWAGAAPEDVILDFEAPITANSEKEVAAASLHPEGRQHLCHQRLGTVGRTRSADRSRRPRLRHDSGLAGAPKR
jgi:hypothetical protein